LGRPANRATLDPMNLLILGAGLLLLFGDVGSACGGPAVGGGGVGLILPLGLIVLLMGGLCTKK